MTPKRDRWLAVEEDDGSFTVTLNGRRRASGLDDDDAVLRAVRRYAPKGTKIEVERRNGSDDTLTS